MDFLFQVARTDVIFSGHYYFFIFFFNQTVSSNTVAFAHWLRDQRHTYRKCSSHTFTHECPRPILAARVVPEAAIGPDIYRQTV